MQPASSLVDSQRAPTSLRDYFGQLRLSSRDADGAQKEIVTAEDSRSLRNSVLKEIRPRNPVFDPNDAAIQAEHSRSASASALTPPRAAISSPKTAKTSPPTIRLPDTRKQTTADRHRRPPAVVPHHDEVDELAIRTALDMRAIDELAADTRRLAANIAQSTSASPSTDNLSPSTYYFSDEERSDHLDGPSNQPTSRRSTRPSTPPHCSKCLLPITDTILTALGVSYHPHCFKCDECGRKLDGVPFAVDERQQVYCMHDYERLFVPSCSRCRRPIVAGKGGSIVRVVVGEEQYHIDCFSCTACGLALGNDADRRAYPLNDMLMCRKCHQHWRRVGSMSSPLTDL